jgi:adenylate cyclase class 2
MQGRHKSREEFETAVSDAANAAKILNRLGFLDCFRYEKYRTEFARSHEPGVVMLDETPIGNFLEIEGPPDWIDETAHELGFDEDKYMTASYGTLYRRHCEAHGRKPSHMVFTV